MEGLTVLVLAMTAGSLLDGRCTPRVTAGPKLGHASRRLENQMRRWSARESHANRFLSDI